jgi:glycosyltransferase involved in cell wall biosynthesis
MLQGTGIKTYGATLVKTLISLEANVNLLCSRSSGGDTRDLILNESLFFDIQKRQDNGPDIIGIISAVIRRFYPATELQMTDFVIKQDSDFVFDLLASWGKIFSVPDCYKIAYKLYKYFNLQTKVGMPKKIDIWHATYPIPIKVNGSKKITTIHDLIPLKLPYTTLDNKKLFFDLIKDTTKNSDSILAVSESTKNDILYCFDIDPDKINVTYQPIIDNSHLLEKHEGEIILKKYKLKPQKYILFVGTIEPKKNIGRLIDAYTGLDTDMQLVIVGKKGWLWENEIGKLEALLGKGFGRRIRLLEYLERKDLTYLYNGAFCFVFPSLYEGFGLPPLEAMSLGCPVITSKVSSLPEVCGDAALYVDPYCSTSIREAIEKLINNSQLRNDLISAGRERVNMFSMEKYAQKIYECYKRLL